MKYMLLIYGDEKAMEAANPADSGSISPAFQAYTEAMRDAGIVVAGDRLKPTTAATTVRGGEGKVRVLDGPYAEAREQLGGYYIIDVPDLDTALEWASRCPAVHGGAIEIRPLAHQ
ncbi:MAG: YciI family protein [Flavobacteriaceae bacterium]